MHEKELVGLSTIIVLGVAAQYLAQLLRIPSILVLLTAGILIGPVLGMVHPGDLFGDMMMPIVSLSVALILFEGGLTLRFKELPGVGGVVTRLMTVGALVTWVLGTIAAKLILGFGWDTSLLLGAILVVTGPTVIDPLVRHIKPSAPIGPILRWEGIVIDPIGASLAVLVFQFLQASEVEHAALETVGAVLRTVVGGGLIGLAGAGLMVLLVSRKMIGEGLVVPMAVMTVISVFTGSNLQQTESGLLAVTVMGIVLANQRFIDTREILEFKENLRVLLISSLFIILAANINAQALLESGGWGVLFALVLILIVRPVSVFFSTRRSSLTFEQKLFLAWMAPRGIVAAAVASVFAIDLASSGGEHAADAAELVPVTFAVIVVTVLVYGLTAPAIANRLGIAEKKPQGVLIVGAHAWGREIARLLQDRGFAVTLVDTNRSNTAAARLAGLQAVTGGILTDRAMSSLDLSGLGRLVALTPNHEVNALACQRFIHTFGKHEVYQLSRGDTREAVTSQIAAELRGRPLFGESVTFGRLAARFAAGDEIKATTLSEEFDIESYRERYGDRFIPLFVITPDHRLTVVTGEAGLPESGAGVTLVSLIEQEALEPPRPQEAEESQGDAMDPLAGDIGTEETSS